MRMRRNGIKRNGNIINNRRIVSTSLKKLVCVLPGKIKRIFWNIWKRGS
jgi:hypothetical protein